MNRPARRYEEAAEIRTDLTGWCCKHCNKYWGDKEDMARYCCSNDRPCHKKGCDRRIPGTAYQYYCDWCLEKSRVDRWDSKPKVQWDGETPLVEWDNDRYLFDADAVAEYIDDVLAEGGSIEDIRLVLAKKSKPREFEMEDFQCDYVTEDDHPFPDTTEINRVVNDWIARNLDFMWEPSGVCVDPRSLPMPDTELSDIEAIDATPLEREDGR